LTETVITLFLAEKEDAMNEIALQEQLARLQNELKLAGGEVDKRLLELRVEVDRLKIELAALKNFMAAASPSFAEQFPQVLARTIEEVNPEFE
jgi:uncharacterized small protein (DUF1192 family)